MLWKSYLISLINFYSSCFCSPPTGQLISDSDIGCSVGGQTMQEKNFPIIPKPLLDELNERYPERSAESEWSDRDIWIKSGERRVIRFLNEMYKRQNENILENHSVL
tara:strand:- start:128 stop:448 length:321 start_codon:yes stop_codon:yes gene_type:complete